MAFCQHGILPTWHFANMAFCQHGIFRTWHFANMAFSQHGICPTWHLPNMAFSQHGILPTRHFVSQQLPVRVKDEIIREFFLIFQAGEWTQDLLDNFHFLSHLTGELQFIPKYFIGVSWRDTNLVKGKLGLDTYASNFYVVDEMTSWQNDKLTKWQVDKMANG